MPNDWSKIIGAAEVPVVIISACALLCLAFYNRLATIVSRLRAFHREQLREEDAKMIEQLIAQVAVVSRRARLIRAALFFYLLGIGLLMVCCMLLGLGVLIWWVEYPSVVVFALGLASALIATILAMVELRDALRPTELESRFVAQVFHSEQKKNLDYQKLASTHTA